MKNSTNIEAHWAQHINSWKKSTLSQNAYCRSHNLSSSQFSYWKRKLQKDGLQESSTGSAFIPVSFPTHASLEERSTTLVLTLPNGCTLSGWGEHDLPLAKQLIEALQ